MTLEEAMERVRKTIKALEVIYGDDAEALRLLLAEVERLKDAEKIYRKATRRSLQPDFPWYDFKR